MSDYHYVDPWGRDPGFRPEAVEVECAVCRRTYSVRADSPGWSSVWTCCISCQANEEIPNAAAVAKFHADTSSRLSLGEDDD